MLAGLDQLDPLKVSVLPKPSTAVQKVAVGHDVESNDVPLSMLVAVDQPAPS